MNVQADRDSANFNVLKDYLRAELERCSADRRAIHLESEASFTKWAHTVLEQVAEKLGIALGYLIGLATGAYESIKSGFSKGFKEGINRGRGREAHG
jgi:hypothetical protein